MQQQQQQPQQQPQALSDGAARGGSAAGGADAQQPGKPQPVAVRRRRFAESARRCLETWGGLDCLTEQQKDVVGLAACRRGASSIASGGLVCVRV